MKTISPILFSSAALIACLLFCGCSHYYYAPNMHNVPLLQKKYETRINVAASSGEEVSSFELQGAHAFSDHVAGMFNFATGGANDGVGDLGHGTFAEGGAGYFYPFGKYFVVEGYSGLGIGGVKNEYGSPAYNSSVTYIKPFIQPDIGIRFSFFELALSSRIAILHYTHVNEFSVPESDKFEFDLVNGFRTTWLFEPAATLRLGYKYVLLQIQIGYSINSVTLFPQEMINSNIGLIFTIPPPKSSSSKSNYQRE